MMYSLSMSLLLNDLFAFKVDYQHTRHMSNCRLHGGLDILLEVDWLPKDKIPLRGVETRSQAGC